MRRLQTRTPAILLERELKEAAAQEAIERLIILGLGVEAWRSWHRYGFVTCPAKHSRASSDPRCRMGVG